MNRRDFLRKMLCAAGVAAAPKFIFDMGANLYKTAPLEVEVIDLLYNPVYEDFHYEIKTMCAPVVISGRAAGHYHDGIAYLKYTLSSLPPGMATKQLLN